MKTDIATRRAKKWLAAIGAVGTGLFLAGCADNRDDSYTGQTEHEEAYDAPENDRQQEQIENSELRSGQQENQQLRDEPDQAPAGQQDNGSADATLPSGQGNPSASDAQNSSGAAEETQVAANDSPVSPPLEDLRETLDEQGPREAAPELDEAEASPIEQASNDALTGVPPVEAVEAFLDEEAELEVAIKDRIEDELGLTAQEIEQINVDVDQGTVTLTGEAPSGEIRSQIEVIVASVDKVSAVENYID